MLNINLNNKEREYWFQYYTGEFDINSIFLEKYSWSHTLPVHVNVTEEEVRIRSRFDAYKNTKKYASKWNSLQDCQDWIYLAIMEQMEIIRVWMIGNEQQLVLDCDTDDSIGCIYHENVRYEAFSCRIVLKRLKKEELGNREEGFAIETAYPFPTKEQFLNMKYQDHKDYLKRKEKRRENLC